MMKLEAADRPGLPGQAPSSPLRWVVSDLATGDVVGTLRDCVQPTTPMRRTIGAYDSATVTLWLEDAPPGWDALVSPLTTVWHAYREDQPQTILWSGTVAQRPAVLGSGQVQLGLSTVEYYLDRRLIDVTYRVTGRPQSLIVSDLITGYVNTVTRDTKAVIDGVLTQGYTLPGVPIHVRTLDDGVARDRTYWAADRVSVYQRLQELSAVEGGPEWTIDWAWNSTGDRLIPTLTVGSRLGSPAPEGLDPAAVFRYPGCLTTATYLRDYAAGKGANSVWCLGAGQGETTPQSYRHLSTVDGNRPTVDLATEPSTSISSVDVLNDHAARMITQTGSGSDSLTMTAALSSPATPVFGEDWHLGDDVYYRLGGWDALGRETAPEIPGGLHGTARVLAAEVAEDGATIAPIVRLNGPGERINTGTPPNVIDGAGGPPRFIFGALPGGLIDGRH